MRIFSRHRKLEPKRRFGGMEFRRRVKDAANYKRMFNPSNYGFGLRIFPHSSIGWRIIRLAAIALLLATGYFMIISTKLVVTEVSITGNHQVSSQQIQDVIAFNGNSRLFLVKKNNFFLMTQGRMNTLLKERIPTIKEIVTYKQEWPNKVTIEVLERTPGFVILSNGEYFLVDDEGIVVSQVADRKNLLVAEDQLVENFAQGEVLQNSKLTPFVLSMSRQWSTKISVLIDSIKFPGKASNDIQFVTAAGWTALFDTTRPVAVQLSDLAVILSKQISLKDQARLAYVDLRLNKKVYYCFKASACSSQEQPEEAGTSTDAIKSETP